MIRKVFLISVFLLLSTIIVGAQDNDDRFTPQELADPDGIFMMIDGVEVYIIAQGEPSNPAILLLHGFGGSTFSWRENITALVDAGYYVIAFDRPPYGLADKNPDVIDYTAEDYATLTHGLMDALNIESAHLVGHSAGGAVIAQFAVSYPEQVDSLIFVAGAVRIPMDESAINSETTPEPEGNGSPVGNIAGFAANLDPDNPLAVDLVRNFVTPDVFIDLLSSAYDPTFEVTDEIATGYQRVLQVDGWERAFITLFAMQEQTTPFDFETFAMVDVPVLIVWGENDTWVPISVGERLQQFLPNADIITYANIGHLPQEENPMAFNADVVDFLNMIDE